MTAAGVSPSSSPRLPSPPPFTEVQIGPQSPSVGETFGRDADLLGVAMGEKDASTRRIRPGTKSADIASGPPVIPISQVGCSPLAVLDITDQYRLIPHSRFRNTSKPSSMSLRTPKDPTSWSRSQSKMRRSWQAPRMRMSMNRYGSTNCAVSSQ
jgi:hypothetical protein